MMMMMMTLKCSVPLCSQCPAHRAVMLFVGCVTSQQHAIVYLRYHIEIEVADQTFYLAQSQYIDTGPASSSADPITPDAWHNSH